FFFEDRCASIAIVGTQRCRQCMVQKRRNRNLRLSEFGINDVLLPQDLLGGKSTISLQSAGEFDSLRQQHWLASLGSAELKRNARNYAWHPNLLFCSKENDRN